MKLDKGECMNTRTVIDTEIIAESLAKHIGEKILENINVVTKFSNGKLEAKISINQDYLKGIQDTIEALASLEVDVYK